MEYIKYKYIVTGFRPDDKGVYYLPSDGIPVGSENLTYDNGKSWVRVVYCLIPNEPRVQLDTKGLIVPEDEGIVNEQR
ncbi:MAG: hypothetical protein PHH85_09090 [Candidatus Methanoperedens sp.]|nr:hypothetical protein [Candidatus Methanoperedens sp.]